MDRFGMPVGFTPAPRSAAPRTIGQLATETRSSAPPQSRPSFQSGGGGGGGRIVVESSRDDFEVDPLRPWRTKKVYNKNLPDQYSVKLPSASILASSGIDMSEPTTTSGGWGAATDAAPAKPEVPGGWETGPTGDTAATDGWRSAAATSAPSAWDSSPAASSWGHDDRTTDYSKAASPPAARKPAPSFGKAPHPEPVRDTARAEAARESRPERRGYDRIERDSERFEPARETRSDRRADERLERDTERSERLRALQEEREREERLMQKEREQAAELERRLAREERERGRDVRDRDRDRDYDRDRDRDVRRERLDHEVYERDRDRDAPLRDRERERLRDRDLDRDLRGRDLRDISLRDLDIRDRGRDRDVDIRADRGRERLEREREFDLKRRIDMEHLERRLSREELLPRRMGGVDSFSRREADLLHEREEALLRRELLSRRELGIPGAPRRVRDDGLSRLDLDDRRREGLYAHSRDVHPRDRLSERLAARVSYPDY
eukprot:TRINITY_DN4124_c0_g1_i3.p1 TRINITY_DN4124_c0_g1~~TRINITY_DN4124_c0_g1_i3.p1  ORF type:complete len:496 (+),score=112.71 TRINITY_DN4124_c0_g1_i3:72-1559(+)